MELGNNNYKDNFTKSSTFKEKIIDLDGGIDILLDEFKKLYVIVNMHPTNQEYQQQYQNVINKLASINSKLFSVSNEIKVNIDDINKQLLNYDVLIRKAKTENKNLKKDIGIVENQNNAASEMITNYKDIYDKSYLRNWSLILSSIIGLIAIRKIYKNPVVV